jgi:tetratricopeptide (TPR) repeat protein
MTAMKNAILPTLLLTLAVQAATAQETIITGRISIHNSRYNTEKIEYVQGAFVSSSFTETVLTDDEGSFTLVYNDIMAGMPSEIRVEKAGYEVVNKQDLRKVVVGRKIPLRVYLAPIGYIKQVEEELSLINLQSLTDRYNRVIAALRQEGEERQAAISELEQKLNRSISDHIEAEELLTQNITYLRSRVPELTKKLASLNLDFATEKLFQMFELFKVGETEKTMAIMTDIDEEKNIIWDRFREVRTAKEPLKILIKQAQKQLKQNQKRTKQNQKKLKNKVVLEKKDLEIELMFKDEWIYLNQRLKTLEAQQSKREVKRYGYPTIIINPYKEEPQLLLMLNECVLAETSFQKSLNQVSPYNPEYAFILGNLALVYESEGLFEEAEETRKKAQSSKPKGCVSEFPWPPPKASAQYEIPNAFFESVKNLGDIKNSLSEALDQCGYFERSYYCIIPDRGGTGFALVARMEQIDNDAFSLPLPDRWSMQIRPLIGFSLKEIVQSFFFKNPGYFRIVVFVVYDEPFKPSPKGLTREAGISLLRDGANKLSSEIAAAPFSEKFSCTALIYEFEVPESGREAKQVPNSKHTARVHLERSKLLEALQAKK